MTTKQQTRGEVVAYNVGFVCISACAPADLTESEVEVAVNERHGPTGLDHGWTIAEPTFAGGEPNGCPCNTDDARRHWLLTC